MLSRVANTIHWLGRYLERAENYARLIDVNINLILDLPPDMKEQWEPVVRVTGDLNDYKERYEGFDRNQVIHYLAFDPANANSIVSSITAARENARSIREHLSKETWQYLNELYHYVVNRARRHDWKREDPRSTFETIRNRILLLYGLAYSTVARTESWYFRYMGTFLERADKTSRFLDMKHHLLLPESGRMGSPLDVLQWTALLKSVTGFNTYRRLYGNIEPTGLVDFMVLNKTFSRSMFFCVKEAENCLYHISGNMQSGYSDQAEKALGALRSQLEFADVHDVLSSGLHAFLEDFQVQLNRVSDHINEVYFQISRPD